MGTFLTAVLQSAIAAAILFSLFWFIGKKPVSQYSILELVSFIAAGVSAAFLAVFGSYLQSIPAILLFALAPVLLSQVQSKISNASTAREGKPTLLIKDGAVQTANLKKKGMTEAELIIECREQGAEIAEIEFAVLEPGGNLHIQKEKSPPAHTFQTSGQALSLGLSLNIIIQGRIIPEQLSVAKRDINWILDELNKQNIYDVHNVLLAYFDAAGQFFVHTCQK